MDVMSMKVKSSWTRAQEMGAQPTQLPSPRSSPDQPVSLSWDLGTSSKFKGLLWRICGRGTTAAPRGGPGHGPLGAIGHAPYVIVFVLRDRHVVLVLVDRVRVRVRVDLFFPLRAKGTSLFVDHESLMRTSARSTFSPSLGPAIAAGRTDDSRLVAMLTKMRRG